MRRLPLLLCSIGMFAYAGYVSSATITVTTTEPGINADGLCSFAEAVDNVNGRDVHSDCEAGSDGLNIIELGQGETYLQRQGDRYVMEEGDVLINGNGSTFDAMDEETGWGFRFGDNYYTSYLGDAIIIDLTINGSEGAIEIIGGRLSLSRCVIEDNVLGVLAIDSTILMTDTAFVSNVEGIANFGQDSALIAINSDFVSNVAAIGWWEGGFYRTSVTLIGCTVNNNGGGISAFSVDIRHSTIFNNDQGVVAESGSITNSTIVGNREGVYLLDQRSDPSPEFTLISSTISGNTEGGIVTAPFFHGHWMGTAYIRDSTVTGNATGLDGDADQFAVKNSIISSNGENCFGYWYGDSSSRGFNLTDDDSCNFNHSTDMVVSDVMLSELGDWGGSTLTHMPLEGSPAIDMVKWAGQCSRLDQRGYLRNADGDGDGVAHCDCGAVEYGSAPPPRPYDPRAYPSEIE